MDLLASSYFSGKDDVELEGFKSSAIDSLSPKFKVGFDDENDLETRFLDQKISVDSVPSFLALDTQARGDESCFIGKLYLDLTHYSILPIV
jgi:hypothetical protein